MKDAPRDGPISARDTQLSSASADAGYSFVLEDFIHICLSFLCAFAAWFVLSLRHSSSSSPSDMMRSSVLLVCAVVCLALLTPVSASTSTSASLKYYNDNLCGFNGGTVTATVDSVPLNTCMNVTQVPTNTVRFSCDDTLSPKNFRVDQWFDSGVWSVLLPLTACVWTCFVSFFHILPSCARCAASLLLFSYGTSNEDGYSTSGIGCVPLTASSSVRGTCNSAAAQKVSMGEMLLALLAALIAHKQ
jgi:hypothetical protein